MKENDLLLVTKIDRCSRNTLEFLKIQKKLFKKGVRFISLDLPYSNDMAVNQLIATNLAAIATFENERRKERKRLRVLDKISHYTKEELDAMDYFHGAGFYHQYHDPELKPNIFDRRQTFLLKMHDPVLRHNFLNSFNSKDYLNYLEFPS